MANAWGFPVIQTDRPGVWLADGYVSITDGYGAPSFATVPSGIVRSVVHNSTGNYSIILQEAWFALVDVHVQTVLPSGSSPALLHAQIESSTVGNAAVLPVQAGGVGQGVTFQVLDSAGSATELPQGSGFVFCLTLKQSSA